MLEIEKRSWLTGKQRAAKALLEGGGGSQGRGRRGGQAGAGGSRARGEELGVAGDVRDDAAVLGGKGVHRLGCQKWSVRVRLGKRVKRTMNSR